MEQVKKILILGGTGIIGRSLSDEIQQSGHDAYVISRNTPREPIEGVTYLQGNARTPGEIKSITNGETFDYVVDLLSFSTQHLKYMINEIKDICDHYIFMSSATVYEGSASAITERSPLLEDGWSYPLQKIKAERWLQDNLPTLGIPYTVVRPYIVYSSTRIPFAGWEGYAIIERIKNGAPIPVGREILDSQTTLTHSTDLARGIASIVNSTSTPSGIFHITANSSMTWREVYQKVAKSFNTNLHLVDTSIQQISKILPELKGKLEDRAISRTFDNSAIKSATGFTTPAMDENLYINTLKQFMQSNQKVDYLLQGRIDSLIKRETSDKDTWIRTLEHRKNLLDRKGVKTRLLYFIGYHRILFILAKNARTILLRKKLTSDYS